MPTSPLSVTALNPTDHLPPQQARSLAHVIILLCKAVQTWGDDGEIMITDPRAGRNHHLDSSPLFKGDETDRSTMLAFC